MKIWSLWKDTFKNIFGKIEKETITAAGIRKYFIELLTDKDIESITAIASRAKKKMEESL